mgnify:CR=1 FL=1
MAKTDATILVTGEIGAGKEIAAAERDQRGLVHQVDGGTIVSKFLTD